MAEDDSALASKILLRHAVNKSKAKSWLIASLGSEEKSTSDGLEAAPQPQDSDGILRDVKYDDENAGIGSVKNSAGADDISNRQLMSANEALRRKLMSKDAYKKYSQGKKNGTTDLKTGRRRAEDNSDDDQEVKGRSNLGSRKQQNGNTTTHSDTVTPSSMIDKTEMPAQTNTPAVTKTRKRPGSYLDQVLAKRQQKDNKKPKRQEKND